MGSDQIYFEMAEIGERIMLDWAAKGQVNYGDAFIELGTRGQFSDIWRKVKKLQRSIWEGKKLVGEQPEQIAAEIIPHCLMLIWLLRNEPQAPAGSVPIGVALEDIAEGDYITLDLITGKFTKVREYGV